jgi:hypothetical protein
MIRGVWRVWLDVWCAATIGLGLVFVGAAHPSTSFAARSYYAMIGREGGVGAPFTTEMAFSLGVLGSVLIGWGVLVLIALRQAVEGRAPWVWQAVTVSLAAWFIPDTAISIATGYALNAVPNLLFLTTFLIPVLATGRLRSQSA